MTNITKHKWSSDFTTGVTVFPADIWISTTDKVLAAGINRDDAIAIAKHFKLLPNLNNGTIVVDTGATISATDEKGMPVSLSWQEDI